MPIIPKIDWTKVLAYVKSKLTPSMIKNIIIGVMAIIILLSMKKCNHYKDTVSSIQSKYDYLAGTKSTIIKNKNNTSVIESPSIITTDAQEIKDLSDQIFNLKGKNEKLIKRVDALVSTHQIVSVPLTIIPFTPDSIKHDTSEMVKRNTVIVPPKAFVIDSPGVIHISGIVTLKGIDIDSLTLPNTITWRVTIQKSGFLGLGKKKTIVQAINSNPYFSNDAMNSLIIEKRTSAWNRWIKPTLVGGAVAFIFIKF